MNPLSWGAAKSICCEATWLQHTAQQYPHLSGTNRAPGHEHSFPRVSPQPCTWIVRVMGLGPSRLLGSLGLKRVSSSLMKGGLST